MTSTDQLIDAPQETVQDLSRRERRALARTEKADAKAAKKAAKATAQAGFRPDIQGLRAVAVLAVVADHFAHWPSGGFVGVDVFFVISGFLITGLLVREYDRSGTISALRFYERRLKRIMPAAILVIVATLAAAWALVGEDRFKSLVDDAKWSALFAGNWRFASVGTDYFAKDMPPSPLQHYWSLSVEEQFYFVWPWLMLGVVLLGVRHNWWHPKHIRRVSFTIITVATVASLAWAFYETLTNPALAYFSTFSRVWELGLGAMVAIAGHKLAPKTKRLRVLVAYAGLAGIAVSLFVVPESPGFPAPWALLPVVSTAVVLWAGMGNAGGRVHVLDNPVARYIGDISYSLYLWHFPVSILILTVVAHGSAAYWYWGLGLMFGLSVLSYHFVENPARSAAWFPRTGRFSLERPSFGWLAYFGLAGALVLGGTYAAHAVDQLETPSHKRGKLIAAADIDKVKEACFGAARLDPSHECEGGLNTGPAVYPVPDKAPRNSDGFVCTQPAGSRVKNCEYGSDRPDALQIALVGDSHAGHLQAALVPQARALNWHITTFLGVGCKLHLQNDTQLGCINGLPEILDRLTNEKWDLIITSGTRKGETATLEEYVGAMKPIVEAGNKLVVIQDVPEVGAPLIDCVNRIGYDADRDCSVSEDDGYDSPDLVAKGALEVGAEVVKTRDLYCVDGRCPAAIGNALVYRDTAGHITATYARSMGPYLIARIYELFPGLGSLPPLAPTPSPAEFTADGPTPVPTVSPDGVVMTPSPSPSVPVTPAPTGSHMPATTTTGTRP